MKHLIKVMIILALVFSTTFIAGRLLGILTVDNVRDWLEAVQNINPLWVIALVIFLLLIDLLVAVPTLMTTILAGFFLGFPLGALAAMIGVTLAMLGGYGLGKLYGVRLLRFLVKVEKNRADLKSAFQTSGPVMILLARAAPMVPEVTACMAGATSMSFWRFVACFMAGTLPYVLIASYAGSISSLDSPQPAIFAALFLYAVLWVAWFFFQKYQKHRKIADAI